MPTIEKTSKSTGQQKSTAKNSAGLKSSSELGLQAEDIALKFYLSKGFRLISRRLKTPFAEVDLLMRSPKGLLTVIEVKTLSRFEFLAHRLSARQKTRLRRTVRYFSERECCQFHFVVVSQVGEVRVFRDVFD